MNGARLQGNCCSGRDVRRAEQRGRSPKPQRKGGCLLKSSRRGSPRQIRPSSLWRNIQVLLTILAFGVKFAAINGHPAQRLFFEAMAVRGARIIRKGKHTSSSWKRLIPLIPISRSLAFIIKTRSLSSAVAESAVTNGIPAPRNSFPAKDVQNAREKQKRRCVVSKQAKCMRATPRQQGTWD